MGKDPNDPLAGKSKALKAALAAVERMNDGAIPRTAKATNFAVKCVAQQSRPAPVSTTVERHKTSEP